MMASDRLFVDTGAWVAIIDPGDQYHGAASTYYRQVFGSRVRFVTTNLVIAETYTLLRRRLGHKVAMHFLELLKASPRLLKVQSTPEVEATAEGILSEYDDQELSYVDAVSFVVMQAQGLQMAFAFDHHFETMGFLRQPYLG